MELLEAHKAEGIDGKQHGEVELFNARKAYGMWNVEKYNVSQGVLPHHKRQSCSYTRHG